MPQLSASRVNEILLDCLLKDEEMDGDTPVPGIEIIEVQGVRSRFGLHKDRVSSHSDEISGLVDELDPQFRAGYTFLQLPFDKHGRQWGEHVNAEELVVLGQAIGRIELLAPREMWEALPGGMPYYMVLDVPVAV